MSSTEAREPLAVAEPAAAAGSLRAYLVAPTIALLALAATLPFGSRYDLGVRDGDGVIGGRLLFVLALVGAFWALGVIPRGVRRARALGGSSTERIREVAGEGWSWRRAGTVLG